ncbi:SLC13 family permease [Glutamicibacter soli]|uniref:SLC13 family permease n=1 Tax=Glutamicibacter soli TaxID=453836 RepID=UPI0034D1E859
MIDFDAVFTMVVVALVLIMLVVTRLSADIVVMGAALVLMLTGILAPEEALSGFSNTGVLTVAVLYVVAAGLTETGAVQWIAQNLLGRPTSIRGAYARMLLPVGGLSAVLNNTTVVAMLLPAVQEWSQRQRLSSAKLLIPLSYMAIVGGTMTLIGTSTNLIVGGLLKSQKDVSLQMFDITAVGLPLTVAAALFIYVFGKRLLPDRPGALEQLETAREYAVGFTVLPDGPIAGKSVGSAGLRNLSHGYLARIHREDHLVIEVTPETMIDPLDELVFIGAPQCAQELRQIRGLVPSAGDVDKLPVRFAERRLVEAVVGADCASLGKTVRESGFRSRYEAVILSISRNGEMLRGKIGDVRLRIGDTLLMETGTNFVTRFRDRRDFMLVSNLTDAAPANYRKAPWAILILVAMVLLNAFGVLEVIQAALLAAAAMLATGCLAAGNLRRHIDLQVIIVIAASFALGEAMVKTGAAQIVAETLLFDGVGAFGALTMVFVVTVIFTELLTNNAAAVLVFPIAMAVADSVGANFMPFAIVLMIAASASFIIPIGYQTNLMVMGPGGYKVMDFIRIGVPMSIVSGVVTLTVVPLVWPL